MKLSKADLGLVVLVGAAVVVLILAFFGGRASADDVSPKDLAPRLSYGLLSGLTRTAQDGSDQYHNDTFAGFGAEVLGLNVINKNTGYNIFGVSSLLMMHGTSASDEFAASPGLGVKILGNFLVGATYDVLNTNPNKRGGFVTGDSSWKDNGAFWVGLIGPLNGGGALFNIFK